MWGGLFVPDVSQWGLNIFVIVILGVPAGLDRPRLLVEKIHWWEKYKKMIDIARTI